MVTWALENAIETADSMKSRGYGLPGRTAFSIYRFDSRDQRVLLWIGFCGICILVGALTGGLDWRYFPTIKGVGAEVFPVSVMLTYLALCLTPVALNLMEDRVWRRLRQQGAGLCTKV